MKTIKGTWFEFKHHNIPEGKYWNPVCRKFTDAQWREKIKEMHSVGMEYLVLMCTSLVYEDSCEAYFETDIYPFASDMVCKDPIGVILDECDKWGMKVFVSVGYYGVWTHTMDNMVNPDVTARAFKAMEQLYALYGKHQSFYGWYYPDETCIDGYFHEDFIKYCNMYSEKAHQIDSTKKTLIAPYGTNILIADDKYVEQLKALDVDIVAYQDEIGVRKSTPEQTGAYYRALREAHDKAGRSALWADMEVFEFEGDVYRSALIPAEMSRIEKQLEAISPYVDVVLCYQYLGMFNQPSTIAFCGHPDSVKLYEDYTEFKNKQEN